MAELGEGWLAIGLASGSPAGLPLGEEGESLGSGVTPGLASTDAAADGGGTVPVTPVDGLQALNEPATRATARIETPSFTLRVLWAMLESHHRLGRSTPGRCDVTIRGTDSAAAAPQPRSVRASRSPGIA